MKSIGKMINAVELVELLSMGQTDAEIAKYFDCHPTVIAKLRRTMMSVKPTIKAPITKAKVTKSNDEPPTKDYVSLRSNVNCQDGSMRLLIRQLETGQHSLNKEQFVAIVKEIGLESRLPRGILNG